MKEKIDPSSLYEEGQILKLTMEQPREGRFPIAKTNEGIICIIEKTDGFFEYGSTWYCEIRKIGLNSLIIKPVKNVLLDKYEVGDQLLLDMLKHEKGYVFARTQDDVFCQVKLGVVKAFPGSTMDCRILAVHENKIVVEPTELYMSKAQNEAHLSKVLKDTFGQVRERKKKERNNYQFKASYERA